MNLSHDPVIASLEKERKSVKKEQGHEFSDGIRKQISNMIDNLPCYLE